jgi:hypothetical protein
VASQAAHRASVAVVGALVGIVVLVAPAKGAVASLPDHRGYELVSPPIKGGADIIPQSNKTHAAADGNGVAFTAVGAFGAPLGTSVDVQYLSRRVGAPGTNGWSTRAIQPRGGGAPTLRAVVTGNIPTFEAAFTPDLSAAIYRSWRPLTDAPNVADVSNLYRLRNLDATEADVQLLTSGAAPLAAVPPELKLFVQSRFIGASRDLDHVVFQSPWNLAGDGGFSFSGNLYEYADGAGVRLVGRVPSGLETACDDVAGPLCAAAPDSQAGIPVSFGGSHFSAGMVSDDGARILFQTPAGVSAGAIYMREDGTKTYDINASEKSSPEPSGDAQVWAMSKDGSRVFFTTSEGLVDGDDDGVAALYMYDVTASAGSRLTRLSVNGLGGTCGAASVLGASDDGHYVYFECDGQLVPGEPTGSRGVFLWHDGALAYIGRFLDSSEARLNTPRANWDFVTQSKTSRVTPDGRFLLFMAQNDDGFRGQGGYAGYDHGTCNYGGIGPCRELYLYSADSGRLACVSCNARRAVATGDALTDVRAGGSASGVTQHLSQALSDDGRRVFFNTTEALVPEDSNGKWDAYEYDVPNGTVHLISTGKDPADSYFLDASPDGHDVFLATRERLVGWDVDANYDVYDARVGGGFPDPSPPSQPCAGESCRAPAAAAVAAAVGASAQYRGAGDAHQKLRRHRKRCKGRAVARRVRGRRKCVHPRGRRHARRRAHGKRSGR